VSIVLADPQTFGGPLWPVVVDPGLRSPGPASLPGTLRNPAISPGRVVSPRFGGRPGGRPGGRTGGRFGRQLDFTNIFSSIQNAPRTIPTFISTNVVSRVQNATRRIPGFSVIAARLPAFPDLTRLG
jgi:hypothetical protein